MSQPVTLSPTQNCTRNLEKDDRYHTKRFVYGSWSVSIKVRSDTKTIWSLLSGCFRCCDNVWGAAGIRRGFHSRCFHLFLCPHSHWTHHGSDDNPYLALGNAAGSSKHFLFCLISPLYFTFDVIFKLVAWRRVPLKCRKNVLKTTVNLCKHDKCRSLFFRCCCLTKWSLSKIRSRITLIIWLS